MLDFSDKAYRYFEPKPNRWVEGLLRWVNRRFFLPGKGHFVPEVRVENAEVVAEARERAGNRLLLLPNHPTHSDAAIMTEVFRRLDLPVAFMAAYDVFLRSAFDAWCMQRMGCFSVDREGSDRASMREAVGILKAGERALVIFPEGNVYLNNDFVTPFQDGPAFLGLKAQGDLREDEAILAVPVSLKVTHLTNSRAETRRMLKSLAGRVSSEFEESVDPVAEVKRLGRLALRKVLTSLSRRDPGEVAEQDLPRALRDLAVEGIVKLEEELDLTAKEQDEPVDRIRKIRRKIHSLRIAENPDLADFKARTLAAEAMLAYRLLTYPGNYLEENPSLDRMAETVEKLLEDLSGEPVAPYVPRRALVRFGEPIDLAAEKSQGKGRVLVAELTRRFEESVQAGVDALNARNDSPGSEPFSSLAECTKEVGA